MWVIFSHSAVLPKKSGQRIPGLELGSLSWYARPLVWDPFFFFFFYLSFSSETLYFWSLCLSWSQYSYPYHYQKLLIYLSKNVCSHNNAIRCLFLIYVFQSLIYQLTSYDPIFLNNFLLMLIALLFYWCCKSQWIRFCHSLTNTHPLFDLIISS